MCVVLVINHSLFHAERDRYLARLIECDVQVYSIDSCPSLEMFINNIASYLIARDCKCILEIHVFSKSFILVPLIH